MKLSLLIALYNLILISTSMAQSVVSRLETYDLATGKRRTIRTDSARFEAPNWTHDGKYLLINEGGRMYQVAVADGHREQLDIGPLAQCNNDHGLTPDGRTLIISNNTKGATRSPSLIYTVPLKVGTGSTQTPQLITPTGPSYWHGVSPDGKTLAFVGERTGPDGKSDFDIYTIPITGGQEARMTNSPGLDDGPEYSPDGQYIYFNSMRTGRMQLWRMRADGSQPEQITNDAYANWFPHVSPDGRWIVFISYFQDQGSAHPADKDVMLRLIDLKAGKNGPIRELARFRGGQGTINVPSWSPDSKSFAFVSY
ncbi:transporter [Fibrisoma montanum]|uniref:Transporter n=1 Tax=Fibrisoma montanum TaxID=2305895 RepID=A0A418MH77_9BACT|nr:TolB family protein [Fibrisoma montanum]RIV26765.1 transporter [Fibrisoma montanum]